MGQFGLSVLNFNRQSTTVNARLYGTSGFPPSPEREGAEKIFDSLNFVRATVGQQLGAVHLYLILQ